MAKKKTKKRKVKVIRLNASIDFVPPPTGGVLTFPSHRTVKIGKHTIAILGTHEGIVSALKKLLGYASQFTDLPVGVFDARAYDINADHSITPKAIPR